MPDYALLILPSTNRVYADAAVGLTIAELEVFNGSVLEGRLTEIREARLGGVPYVTFQAPDLDERDTAYLANLSSGYALFRVTDGLLAPIELHRLDKFDDDLITIQKYQGKTNEQFTKLLLNVTLLASASAPELLERRLQVLDPLCGRGTTLNQAIMYGYDAAGIDLDQRDFDAYAAFLRTWLRRKRIKHHADVTRIRKDKRYIGRLLTASIGVTKDGYKAGDHLTVRYVNADTVAALEHFGANTFDVIVADTPYGVQHGSRTAEQGLHRSPLDLIAAAAPVWAALLRPGGALGLSWNTNVASRADATKFLADAGLEPLDSGPYLNFRHRVDQAIMRDILVAVRPR
jgi:SAM-dependent methyltransferase